MRGCRKAEKENKRKKNGIIYGAHNFHVQTDMSSTYLQRRQMYTKKQWQNALPVKVIISASCAEVPSFHITSSISVRHSNILLLLREESQISCFLLERKTGIKIEEDRWRCKLLKYIRTVGKDCQKIQFCVIKCLFNGNFLKYSFYHNEIQRVQIYSELWLSWTQ